MDKLWPPDNTDYPFMNYRRKKAVEWGTIEGSRDKKQNKTKYRWSRGEIWVSALT